MKISEIFENGKLKLAIGIAVIIIVVSIIIITVVSMINYGENETYRKVLDVDTIYNEIYVDNNLIGGMTKEEAKRVLEMDSQSVLDNYKIILMVNNEEEIELTYKQLGVKYDIDTAVEEAYQYCRDEDLSLEERYKKYEELQLTKKYDITLNHNYDSDEVRQAVTEQLQAIADKVYVAPTPKKTIEKDGNIVEIPAENGKEIDLEANVESIISMLARKANGEVLVIRTKEIQA